jgi:phosphorylcholine metabolism protein LicD
MQDKIYPNWDFLVRKYINHLATLAPRTTKIEFGGQNFLTWNNFHDFRKHFGLHKMKAMPISQ